MIQCEVCKKEFKTIKSLSQHLAHPLTKKNHYILTTKEYYDKFLKNEKEGICKINGCSKETTFVNLDKGYLEYCSHKCYNLDPEIRLVRSESNRNRKFSKETREKMSISKIENWKDPDSWFNSKECKEKCKRVMKNLWEKEGSPFNLEWRNMHKKLNFEKLKTGTHPFQSKYFKEVILPKRSKNKKEWMLNGGSSYLNSFNRKIGPSKPQLHIFNIVKEIYPTAEIELPCLNFYLDIVILEHKIVIEYDGGWWHQNKKYDEWRQGKVEKEGWSFIRYCGTIQKDFYPPKEQILEDISNKIKEITK